MKICVKRGINRHLVGHTKVISLETGEMLKGVFYVDDQKGDVGKYVFDEEGKHVIRDNSLAEEVLTDQLIKIELDATGKRYLEEYGEIPKSEEGKSDG